MIPREAADTARALVEDLNAWLSDQPDEETRAAATQTQAILVALGPLVAAAERADILKQRNHELREELDRAQRERNRAQADLAAARLAAGDAAERADTLEAALREIAQTADGDKDLQLEAFARAALAAGAAGGTDTPDPRDIADKALDIACDVFRIEPDESAIYDFRRLVIAAAGGATLTPW